MPEKVELPAQWRYRNFSGRQQPFGDPDKKQDFNDPDEVKVVNGGSYPTFKSAAQIVRYRDDLLAQRLQ
ncbi:hypothetical protein ACFWP0_06600 [Achromobacter sp. NPDC058515]|uniref:hypothetical protein n=1 Tax=Achromobacter sp. NPDC058515 TaxID=3346533 RepID=UPI003657274C